MDKDYWDSFYAKRHTAIEKPSTFAEYVHGRISPGSAIFELGCGNGRDAIYFASQKHDVTACDQSSTSIEGLVAQGEKSDFPWPKFICAGFESLGDRDLKKFDVVYSRFTMHAVPKEVATTAYNWTWEGLRSGGAFWIEVRSVKGSLYGKGKACERDAFIYNDHYRRFLRIEELTAELTSLGFVIEHSEESSGLSVYKEDDPVLIRLLARKP